TSGTQSSEASTDASSIESASETKSDLSSPVAPTDSETSSGPGDVSGTDVLSERTEADGQDVQSALDSAYDFESSSDAGTTEVGVGGNNGATSGGNAISQQLVET